MKFKQFIVLSMLSAAIISLACKQNHKSAESKRPKIAVIDNVSNSIVYDKILDGSVINWNAAHLGGIDPRIGKIYCDKATILMKKNEITNANIIIDMENISVDNIPEDGANSLVAHLKSEDFFNIKEYPTASFQLSNLLKTEGEFNSKVSGNLIILGVSKGISFNANVHISKTGVSINSEAFEIDRSRWGMTYNAKGTMGVPLDYLISDDIGFQINITVGK